MSTVYFTKDLNNVAGLFSAAGFDKIISPQDFVALKIHFGEKGNQAFLKPDRVKPIVKKVREAQGRPFWTDSNTLYKGSRSDTLVHLQTAFDHGYTFGKTGAHVLIADGLEGKNQNKLKVNFKHFKELYFGALALEADTLISIAHFKGHEVAGFGGAIKNISMGLASRAGKQQMHADIKPLVDAAKCTACGKCLKWCPVDAISWSPSKKALIDSQKCIGCAECVATCRFGAIAVCWEGETDVVQKKMVEYAAGLKQHFKEKMGFINFICDVSEQCDCYPFNSEPIVPDIGILASFDPVALDQACADLVNQTAGRVKDQDKFKSLHPTVDWEVQLKYAEEIGLGKREYKINGVPF